MNNSTETTLVDADDFSAERRRGLIGAAAVVGLGILIGLSGCAGPLDPIITEQPDDRDPTTDPTDGTSFHGWMSEVQFAFHFGPEEPHTLG